MVHVRGDLVDERLRGVDQSVHYPNLRRPPACGPDLPGLNTREPAHNVGAGFQVTVDRTL